MKAVIEWIREWIREHRKSTHGLALAIGGLAILVQTDTHIRDLMVKDLDIHPKIISTLACVGAILLAYKQPRRRVADRKQADPEPVEPTDPPPPGTN